MLVSLNDDYHLLSHAAIALARSQNLGKMLDALKTMSDRNWQLDVAIKNPTFNHFYHGVFTYAGAVYHKIKELAAKYPKIKVLSITGEAAAYLVSNYASYPHYEPDESTLKHYVKDKTPLSTSADVPYTLLVPHVVYEHRCPHCKKMIGEKDTAMSGTQMVHRACGKPFAFSSPPAEVGREKNL